MKWIGVGLTIAGAIVGFVAGFQFHSWAWTIGGIVFFAIGIIILILFRNGK
jgi:putative Mn2+ efflux pump MntP